LLDVGGGVGVVTFELLADGLGPATLVDGSPSNVDAASAEAERLGHSSRVHFRVNLVIVVALVAGVRRPS
jgi:16S rRNA G966 N2-methylase RsmD